MLMIKEFKLYKRELKPHPNSFNMPTTAKGFYKYQIQCKNEGEFNRKFKNLKNHLKKHYQNYKIIGVEKLKKNYLFFDNYIISLILRK